jgi:two-component system copper resistance phosphate regulon response regulator CusR
MLISCRPRYHACAGEQGSGNGLGLLTTPEEHVRVLLVEDDHKVAGFLEQGLREEEFEVDHARDGGEAIALATERPYDIVLLDFMLPVKSGPEVAAELRARGRYGPILMLTARDSAEDRREAFEAGATDFMSKPFRFQELLNRMRSLMAQDGG